MKSTKKEKLNIFLKLSQNLFYANDLDLDKKDSSLYLDSEKIGKGGVNRIISAF